MIITSNDSQILISLFTGFLSFLPMMLGVPSNLESSILRQSLNSKHFQYSSLALLSLALPLTIEMVLEWFSSSAPQQPASAVTEAGTGAETEAETGTEPGAGTGTGTGVRTRTRTRRKTETGTDTESASYIAMNRHELVLFIAGICAVPILAFFPDDAPNLGQLYLCLSKCQLALVSGVYMIWLCRFNKRYWTPLSTVVALVTIMIHSSFLVFADNAIALNPNAPPHILYDLLQKIGFFALGPCGCIFLFNSCRWLFYELWPVMKRTMGTRGRSRPVSGALADKRREETRLLYSGMFVVSIILCMLFLGVNGATANAIANWNANQVMYSNLAFITFVLTLSILAMHTVKFEMVQSLYALIEAKRTYVRYISHELRTPLNCAFLGLKMLAHQYDHSDDASDKANLEILDDVNLSCVAALDILNDLLCLDKLENGMLEMNGQEIAIGPFLKSCVDMFSAQARESGVHFECTIGVSNPSPILTENDSNDGNISVAFSSAQSTRTSPTQSFSHSLSSSSSAPALGVELPLLVNDVVLIDRFKMSQVLRNLISNALKFTTKGGTVTLKAVFVPAAGSDGDGDNEEDEDGDGAGTGAGAGTPWLSMLHLMGMRPDASNDSDTPYARTEGGQPQENHLMSLELGSFHNRRATRSARTKGVLRITVTDTGVGISEENQRRLFKEVVQFSPEKLQSGGGSGFGLCIVKGIVDLHGGEVRVWSEGENKGSSFVVEIPMMRQLQSVQTDDHARCLNADPRQVPNTYSNCASLDRSSSLSNSNSRCRSRSHSNSSMDSQPLNWTGRDRGRGGPFGARSATHTTAGGASTRPTTCIADNAISTSAKATTGTIANAATATATLAGDIDHATTAIAELRAVKSTMEILLVDDDTKNRKMISRYLLQAGYGKCDEAVDGQAALDMVGAKMDGRWSDESRGYAVVLMDFAMPVMDGPRATAALRKKGYQGLIFGLTGNVLPGDTEYFVNKGLDMVLLKPLDSATFDRCLTDAIRHLLRKRDITTSDKTAVSSVDSVHPHSAFNRPFNRPPALNPPPFTIPPENFPGSSSGVATATEDPIYLLKRTDGPPLKSALKRSHENGLPRPVWTMLLVDDSRRNRRVMAKTLQLCGVVCDEAEDGRIAVDKVRERLFLVGGGRGRMYDGILMDLIMPNMGGDVAAKEIRELGFEGAIVGMTGSSEKEDHACFLAAGGNRVLMKPLELTDLDQTLQDLLEPRHTPLEDEDSHFSVAMVGIDAVGMDGCGATDPSHSLSLQLSQPLPWLQQLSQTEFGALDDGPLFAPNGEQYGLLIVDDSRRNRRALGRRLCAGGFVCDEADDGQTAIAKVLERIGLTNVGGERMYDAILMNILMPNMDGDVAAKEIRELGFEGAIIGLKGTSEKEDHARFLAAGGNRVLMKPCCVAEVKATLRSCDLESQSLRTPTPTPHLQTHQSYLMSLLPPPPTHSTHPTHSLSRFPPRTRHSGRSLLIVDDSYFNRNMVVQTLQRAGYTCDEADDGQTAVAAILQRISLINKGEERMYDGILMDILMLNMDGDDATREIRDLGFEGAIVGMTGSSEKDDHARFLEAGGNKVLMKPLELADLDQTLQGACAFPYWGVG